MRELGCVENRARRLKNSGAVHFSLLHRVAAARIIRPVAACTCTRSLTATCGLAQFRSECYSIYIEGAYTHVSCKTRAGVCVCVAYCDRIRV